MSDSRAACGAGAAAAAAATTTSSTTLGDDGRGLVRQQSLAKSREITQEMLDELQGRKLPPNLAALRPRAKQYVVFFTSETATWAEQLYAIDADKYVLARCARMDRFADGTLNAEIYDIEHVRDRHIIYLASFSSYERLYEDYAALVVLCQSFPLSVTIVLPFFPSGTMERVAGAAGTIATANIDSWMLQTLPCPGAMNRFVIMDLHTLQNKFYFHHTAMADLISAVPAVPSVVDGFDGEWRVAFPDDGAQKRFGAMFTANEHIVCGKVRQGERRIVKIKEGEPEGRSVLIVDDLVQSGGTLVECMKELRARGARRVCAWVTHAVLPNNAYRRFLADGDGADFEHFYTTDSRPTIAAVLAEHPDRFTIVPISAIVHEVL